MSLLSLSPPLSLPLSLALSQVDPVDKNGRAPIFYAAKNGCEESARFLIRKGADVTRKDNIGKTVRDVARPGFEQVIASALKERCVWVG